MHRHGLIAVLAIAIALNAAAAQATGIKVPGTTPVPPHTNEGHRPPPPPRPPIHVPTPPRPVTPPVIVPPIAVPPVKAPAIPVPVVPNVEARITLQVPAEILPPIPPPPRPPLPVGLLTQGDSDETLEATQVSLTDAPAQPFRFGAPSSALIGVAARDLVANRVVVAIPLARADATRSGGDLATDYGLSVESETTLPSLGVRLVTFTLIRPRGLGDLLDQMGLDSRVQSAQPVFRYRLNAGPAPASYPALRMQIPSARTLASGIGVTVALVDTRVAELPSLRGHVVERVALTPGGDGLHGTALAGLIAAIAPDARLVAIEAFDERPNGGPAGSGAEATTLTLARAIDVALNRKSDVINLSIAGPRDPLIGRMVRLALSQGSIVTAAAGNDGPDAAPRYPAAYDGVIAVTAIDSRDQLYPFAARGPHIAVAAPGVDVAVELPDNMVGYFSGTSIAAAEVAGIAALLRERAPRMNSAEARRLLKETASPLPEGTGVVDAFAALSRASPMANR